MAAKRAAVVFLARKSLYLRTETRTIGIIIPMPTSAFGTKQTRASAAHMSAFGGKADIPGRTAIQLVLKDYPVEPVQHHVKLVWKIMKYKAIKTGSNTRSQSRIQPAPSKSRPDHRVPRLNDEHRHCLSGPRAVPSLTAPICGVALFKSPTITDDDETQLLRPR